MRLLFDQDVVQHVADIFIRRGHDVSFSRDVLQQNSPDQLVAISAAIQGLIVVTNDKDYKRYSELFPQGYQRKARKMTGRIVLAMNQARTAARVEELIEDIEYHHAQAVRRGKRLMITISETNMLVIDNARMS